MKKRPKKKSDTKKWRGNSPWFIGLTGGIIGAFLVGVVPPLFLWAQGAQNLPGHIYGLHQ